MTSYRQATEQEFLQKNRITQETWEKSDISWEQLQAIAVDHDDQHERLRDSAELFARVIQRFPAVHSVRWRIKDTDHLLSKIVRKRAEAQEKYMTINASNYFETVTDLIGLRALHLFKEDCFTVGAHLQETWATTETPIAYIRHGDPSELVDRFTNSGLEVKSHPAGYRSIHYVFSTQPMQRKVFAEVQVRTIFEEGWSEIDHRVRYPNYSDDPLVSYFLTIFNRLAGSADEMGTFVQGLTHALGVYSEGLDKANKEKEEALQRVETIVSELEAAKQQDKKTQAVAAALQDEIRKLRKVYEPLSEEVSHISPTNSSDSGILPRGLLISEREKKSIQTLARWANNYRGFEGTSAATDEELRKRLEAMMGKKQKK